MRKRYLHLKQNSGARALLKLRGVKFETDEEEQQQAANNRNALKPLICKNCNETNEPSAKSCRNPECGMILSYDHYKATTKEFEQTKQELAQIRDTQKQTTERLEQMSQRYMKAFELVTRLGYNDAHKFVNELLRGLPGQRAYEERQRKKKAENILYGD